MLIALRDPAELGALSGKPGETLAETLRRTLLEMIVSGYFEPGFRLYPERLAAQFSVSLTPVREALMRLASEGFIEGVQRRGFHVRTPDEKLVRDLWQVRLALELMAGELVIDRLDAGDLSVEAVDRLGAIQDEIEADPERVPQARELERNSRLHHSLVGLSGNALLQTTYGGIQLQVMTAWVRGGRRPNRGRHVAEAEEHRAIIGALLARDRAAYAAAMRRHLARSLGDALRDIAARTPSRGADTPAAQPIPFRNVQPSDEP